ncbi:MAG: VCBS repeat-containing protein [Cyanobacteria bacterium P01_A01_bin.114]
MATTVLYDPITNPDPTALDYLTYGQLPLSPRFIAEFPPAELSDITDVFEIPAFPQSTGASGVNLDTNGLIFNNLPGYNPLVYYATNGVTKIPTGNTFSANNRTGYAGFTNYSIDVDLGDIDLDNLDITEFVNDIDLTAINAQFPELDADQGFTLTFDLAINEEDSGSNRAGFSLIVISDDLTKGIEIGFKEEGANSDRIFAQNANLNAATEGESSTAALEISDTQQYSLTFLDDSYELRANNTLLLQGSLRDYSFDPTNSDPPFPSNVNPYETPNFVFLGDNTDQGYADFTLGSISVEVEDDSGPGDVPAQPDFDNDQKADLVWRNYKTGRNALWYMDGANLKQAAYINTDVADPNWRIEGVGDFGGDETPEIVWRNYTTGRTALWYMEGANLSSAEFVNLDVPNPDWQIEAVDDFDNNGSADLVWRNYKTGKNALWYMDGSTVERAEFIQSVASPDWHIEGAGDFDQNGQVDLVWRNYANGQNAIWYMDGANLERAEFIQSLAGRDWRIEGVGDYNNNGSADLVWRNYANGSNALWYMNGANLEQGVFIDTSVANPDWQIAVA